MGEVEPAGPRPIAVALAGDPPLPGERLDGWNGLLVPATALQERSGPGIDGEVLDLQRALSLARARNPDLVSADADAEAARWAAVQAGRLPKASIEVETFRAGDRLEVEGGVEIGVTDALLAPARRRALLSGADAERHRAAEVGARLTYDVTAAYYAAVAAEARLGVGQRALDALAAARDVAEARVSSGNASALEAAMHAAAYERARGEIAALELAREAERERLNTLLGLLGMETEWRIEGAFSPLPESLPSDPMAERQAVAASHGLAASRARLDQYARLGALARTERGAPDVSVALLGAGEPAPGTEGEWRAGVGLHATLPALDGGRAEGRMWAARFDAEAARARGLLAETGASVRGTRARLETAHARALHERDVVLPAWRRVTRETLLHHNAMQVGVYELIQARADELAAELAHIETQRGFWTALAAWDALLAGARVDGESDIQTIELGGAPVGGGH